MATGKRDHLFKPGQSGNPAGRKKGSGNKFKTTIAQIRQMDDLALTRQFLRAVVTNDSSVLSKLGITDSPTVTAKITAAKELNKVNGDISAKAKEAEAAQKATNSPVKNTEVSKAQFQTTVSPINKQAGTQ